MVIGYYVHHHGAGHRTRAQVLSEELRRRGHDVVLLGSGLDGASSIDLPRDDGGPGPFMDPTAEGALHWSPLRHPGYSRRMDALTTWVHMMRPGVVVVDVSVEVVVCLRLLGIPTVVIAQPGKRDDDAHTLAFRCATAIVAPWPAEAQPCPALLPFAYKTVCTGGISRLTTKPTHQENGARGAVGVVLSGRDELVDDHVAAQVRTHLPDLTWVEAGGHRWVDDIGALLAQSTLAVTHGGQNAIADLAARDVPAIVCPQPRPHSEQHHLSAELNRLELAADASQRDWASALLMVLDRPSHWSRWRTEGAAERACDVIEGVFDE